MYNSALLSLADDIATDRTVSAEEALQLRKEIFPDGIVSRQEAEVLIALAARVANSDEAWVGVYVESIVDHVLQSGTYPGHIDEATAQWLMDRFGDDGAVETEMEVILRCVERSESAPEALSAFARQRVAAYLRGHPIGESETELVRRCLYAASGAGATSVTEAEARWMFGLDAESAGRANAPSWSDLFVKSALNHLMGRRAPALLQASAMLARESWHARDKGFPGSSVLTMFEGGLKGFLGKLREASTLDRLEAHYERSVEEMQSDECLTLEEMAWMLGMTQEDGMRTPNEEALLTALREIETEQASATALSA